MEPGQFGVTAGVAYPVPEIPAIELPEGASGLASDLAGVEAVVATSEEGL